MRLVRMYRMALAMCTAYRLAETEKTQAAYTIVAEMLEAPARKQQAAAHRVARRLLAERWALPVTFLPSEPGSCQAVGMYEECRDECDGVDEEAAFDLHSMHFAIENGVCPRCAQAGEFGDAFGVCPCGYGYGYRQPSEGGEEPPCTGKATPRHVVVRLTSKW